MVFAIHWHESAMGVHVSPSWTPAPPPPSSSHPSGLSQCSGLDWWSISHMVISSAFSKSTLNIWRFMVHVLLKTGLKNFEHYFASLRDECNCAINPTIELPELMQDWGNRLLEGIKRTLCAPGPKRKKQWPTKDWLRLSCECPGVSSRGMGQWWPAAGSGALSAAVNAWDLLKEVTIIFITSTIV